MNSTKDILTKEIESWGDYAYALREENRILFNKKLSECKREYIDYANVRGENFSAEALFLILIFEQQKMIRKLITKLSDMKNGVYISGV